jgi:hypothetical protein
MNCQQVLKNIYVFLAANILYIFTDFSERGIAQSQSPIYLLTIVRINWDFVAFDLPLFFSPYGRKNRVRAWA